MAANISQRETTRHYVPSAERMHHCLESYRQEKTASDQAPGSSMQFTGNQGARRYVELFCDSISKIQTVRNFIEKKNFHQINFKDKIKEMGGKCVN